MSGTYKTRTQFTSTTHSDPKLQSINMHATQITAVLLALASFVAAGAPIIAEKGYYAYPKYSYSYGVDDKLTGDHKTATETRDGGVVKGSYSLLQPDGVLRTVEYVADPIHGFQAKVINSAPGVHAVKVAPAYAAKPLVGGYGHGGIGLGGHAGHGLGYGGAIAKPAAVAYTQAVGPVAFGHGGGYGGFGHGSGYGGFAHGGGYGGGFHGGY